MTAAPPRPDPITDLATQTTPEIADDETLQRLGEAIAASLIDGAYDEHIRDLADAIRDGENVNYPTSQDLDWAARELGRRDQHGLDRREIDAIVRSACDAVTA